MAKCQCGKTGSNSRPEGFKSYKLKLSGMVDNPVELSLDEMRALGAEESITMHHCIQGWSGIAQWRGISMRKLIELVKPKPYAKVSHSTPSEAPFTAVFTTIRNNLNAMKPECLLAFEMNGEPLPAIYGAPLRLRVENQLGYKMVKWIERIEFVESEKQLGEGEGGNERRRRILRSAAEHLIRVKGLASVFTKTELPASLD